MSGLVFLYNMIILKFCPSSSSTVSWFFKILFLSDLCTQHGAQSHTPEIKSHLLH